MLKYVLGVWSNCRHCCRTGAGLLCYASTIQKHGNSHLQVVVACFKHMFSHAFTGTCNAQKNIEAFFMNCSDQKRLEQPTSEPSLLKHRSLEQFSRSYLSLRHNYEVRQTHISREKGKEKCGCRSIRRKFCRSHLKGF